MTMEDLKTYFQITKVGKSPAKYDEDKLDFFNSQFINRHFMHFNEEEKKDATNRFKKILIEQLPES